MGAALAFSRLLEAGRVFEETINDLDKLNELFEGAGFRSTDEAQQLIKGMRDRIENFRHQKKDD